MRAGFVWALISAVLAVTPVVADPIGDGVDNLPVFDAHVHYKEPAWGQYPPGTVIELMDKAGVAMALVSSTPDDGTIKLFEYAPNRIVPEVRPYHGGWGSSNWTRAPEMLDYLRGRLDAHPHVGIGEFHAHSIDTKDDAFLRQVAKMAAERNVLLHIHTDEAETVKFFYDAEPKLTIIWAHAGMSAAPGVIEKMMDTYSTLYADLSYREHEILGAEDIEPEWKHLLTKHSDKFMVGSDTWANAQCENYVGLINDNRRWISYFPKDLAEKFAYKNAEKLFGINVDKSQIGTR
ncbi:MAG: amidohydrolase family protein [Rhodospirillales bacterium]